MTKQITAMTDRLVFLATAGRFVVTASIAFLTVVDLFAVQAILPALTRDYGVSPATMAIAVNASMIGMALGALGVAFLGPRIDRRLGIMLCLILLAIPTLLLATLPGLVVFTALRIAQGVCMASAFALTLAYLGDHARGPGSAAVFAAYITGNVASNLIGRLISAGVADHFGLAANFLVFAGLNLSGALLVYRTVRSKPVMQTQPERGSTIGGGWRVHFTDTRIVAGFAIGFCILFAFIGTFTFVNFVLIRPPLSLGMMQVGFAYLVFLPSVLTTPLAGATARRLGVRPALWGALATALCGLPFLVVPSLPAVLLGMVLVAVGTFFAQAVATEFVSRSATADRGTASGIYLASYFGGGLIGSLILGQLFDRIGWGACVTGVGCALVAAAVLAIRLRTQVPTSTPFVAT